MLTDEIINFMRENISSKNKENFVFFMNCFLYAINCDVPLSKIKYTDALGNWYCGSNLGEASDSFKIVRTKEELRLSFLKDCEALGIEVKSVAENYELTNENEWLVSLYYTKPFLYNQTKISDFHFIKKKFGEDTWTHKFPEEAVRSTDKTGFPITSPTNFAWYVISDDYCCIDYEYIDTYCLRRKKI